MSVRFMDSERIARLAYENQEDFLFSLGEGRQVAQLHIESPLSDDPLEDAIRAAAFAGTLCARLARWVDTPDQIDAMIQGAIIGAELEFDRLVGVKL
jgi:hypothetical protein